jgi:hypothetical protein
VNSNGTLGPHLIASVDTNSNVTDWLILGRSIPIGGFGNEVAKKLRFAVNSRHYRRTTLQDFGFQGQFRMPGIVGARSSPSPGIPPFRTAPKTSGIRLVSADRRGLRTCYAVQPGTWMATSRGLRSGLPITAVDALGNLAATPLRLRVSVPGVWDEDVQKLLLLGQNQVLVG